MRNIRLDIKKKLQSQSYYLVKSMNVSEYIHVKYKHKKTEAIYLSAETFTLLCIIHAPPITLIGLDLYCWMHLILLTLLPIPISGGYL